MKPLSSLENGKPPIREIQVETFQLGFPLEQKQGLVSQRNSKVSPCLKSD